MSSTYTKTLFKFPDGSSEAVHAGAKFDSVVVTYPTDTVPYWTVAFTCTGDSTKSKTIYTSQLIMINPA